MAGLLESLAMGLRGAGGVMSEDVYKTQRSEENVMRQLMERRKDLMAQQVIKAAETGAMPPEAAQEALSKLGYQGVAVGPTVETQDRVRRADADNAYRAALDRIGADAPLEQQAALAARFGKPEIAAQLHTALEARKAREFQIVSELQRSREKLTQDLQIAQQRGADQRELAQMRIDAEERMRRMTIDAQREMRAFVASQRQAPAPVIVEIADPKDPTKSIKIDARTREVIGVAPPKQAAEKSLPKGAIDSLAEAGGIAADFVRLTDNFQDTFGGKYAGVVGEAQNVAGRNVPGSSYAGQSQWWQDYQEKKNVMRNKLFGAALTATEKVEFDKAQINPGMTAEQIRTNLGRQKAAAVTAARKLATAYEKGGYSKGQIEAALGIPLDALAGERTQTGGASGGWSIREK